VKKLAQNLRLISLNEQTRPKLSLSLLCASQHVYEKLEIRNNKFNEIGRENLPVGSCQSCFDNSLFVCMTTQQLVKIT